VVFFNSFFIKEAFAMDNLNTQDRIIRTAIGASLLLSMLVLPLSPLILAALSLASFYPLLTALVAWDPIYQLALTLNSSVKKTRVSAMDSQVREKVHV
jgi:hypothetical protein